MTAFEFTVETGNGTMAASVTHEAVRLRLAPGYYQGASRASLADRIAEIGALVGQRRDSSRRRALGQQFDVYVPPDRLAVGARATAFRDLRDRLVSEGSDADEIVRIRTVGLTDWQVEVSAEVPQLISERWFLDAASTALTIAVDHHVDSILLLRAQLRTGASSSDVARARELLAMARATS